MSKTGSPLPQGQWGNHVMNANRFARYAEKKERALAYLRRNYQLKQIHRLLGVPVCVLRDWRRELGLPASNTLPPIETQSPTATAQ